MDISKRISIAVYIFLVSLSFSLLLCLSPFSHSQTPTLPSHPSPPHHTAMSAINYSKWDNIELSDDEDALERHPNIDHASMVRWNRAKIHQERDERRHRIAAHQQELDTNRQLKERILKWAPILEAGQGQAKDNSNWQTIVAQVQDYERDKTKFFPTDDQGNLTQALTVDQVFLMLISKVCEEKGVRPVMAGLWMSCCGGGGDRGSWIVLISLALLVGYLR